METYKIKLKDEDGNNIKLTYIGSKLNVESQDKNLTSFFSSSIMMGKFLELVSLITRLLGMNGLKFISVDEHKEDGDDEE